MKVKDQGTVWVLSNSAGCRIEVWVDEDDDVSFEGSIHVSPEEIIQLAEVLKTGNYTSIGGEDTHG